MPHTVHHAFAARARRQPAAPFLCTEPVTAAAYGIDAGDLALRRACWRESNTCANAMPRPVTATATAPACCWKTGPTSSAHWFALNALGVSVVPINADMRAAELGYLLSHSELCLAISLPQRIDELRAAADPARVPVLLPPDHDGAVPPRTWPHRRPASRSATTANVRCSTPRAPPGGRRAAC